jgi:hypothetical protein
MKKRTWINSRQPWLQPHELVLLAILQISPKLKRSSKMENNFIFKPETIDACRQACSEKKEILEYMRRFARRLNEQWQ